MCFFYNNSCKYVQFWVVNVSDWDKYRMQRVKKAYSDTTVYRVSVVFLEKI